MWTPANGEKNWKDGNAMKTLSTSTIPHLAGKMKKSTILSTSGQRRRGRSLLSYIGTGAIFVMIIAAAFYTSSSASSLRKVSRTSLPKAAAASGKKLLNVGQTTSTRLPGSGEFLSAFMPAPQPPQGPPLDESIATYEVVAGLCTATPKNTFLLGETVCAKASNAPLRTPTALRRFNWADTSSFVRQSADVLVDPDTNLFTLPTGNTSVIDGQTVDNRGNWSVSINSTENNMVRAIAYFKVSDPANIAGDLAIYNFSTDADPVTPGASTGFFLWLSNTGPDASLDVHVTQAVPPNLTFVDTTQQTGPTFNCQNNAGVIDCSIATLASGATATLTINYTVDGGAPDGVISSEADISSNLTNDPRLDNNSSEARVEVRSPGGTPATCALGCPSDVVATANTTNPSNPNESGAFVTYSGSVEVSGDCGTIAFSPTSGSFFSVGTHAVNVTSATGGGSCSFTVTVVDSAAPTIQCPPDKTAQAPAGQTSTSVDVGTATATGTGVSVSGTRSDSDCHPQPGETCSELTDPYPVGTTIITWTATDVDGRTASCKQSVTVTSADAFSISCPPARSFTANDCAGFTASANDIGSPTTNGGQAPIVVEGQRSDNLHLYNDPYPVGQTIITWTATDDVGRVASCTQAINVTTGTGGDTTPPTLHVPPNVSATTSSCTATLDDELGVATAEDNCSSVTITRSGVPTFACPTPSDPNRRCESFVFPTGTTVITYTARDASGNTTTGTQNVTVTESPAINPTVSAPADSSAFADANCQAPVPNYTAGSTASDNCGTVTLSQSPTAGSLVGYGPHTVTVTATDPSGNTASDTVVFTVNDNTPPTITAPADSSAFADANCLAPVPDYRPGTTTADNCGSVTLSQSPAPGTLVGYGPHNVVVTADDGHGNTNNDTVVFTVNDNTPPVFTSCPSSQTIEPTCPSGAIATYATPTATDNCAVTVTRTAGPASGSVFSIGTTTVTYTANDGHGNTATCTFTVTVLTSQAVVQNLINSVNSSSLTGTQKNGLLAKLNAALDGINQGKINVACNKLSDFVNNVQTLISHGDITAAQGNAWISSANHVRNTIGCTNLPCS
jgi:hypothetical protein